MLKILTELLTFDRFGPEIAFVANKCLTAFKEKDHRTLVGGKKVMVVTKFELF